MKAQHQESAAYVTGGRATGLAGLTAAIARGAMPRGMPGDAPSLVRFSAIYWIAVFALALVQARLGGFGLDPSQLGIRAAINLSGFVICLGLGLMLQRATRFSLGQRIVMAAALCIPIGCIFGALDALLWKTAVPTQGGDSFLELMAIRSLGRILLLVLWCSLFLSFQYAAELAKRERSLLEARALAREAQLRMLQYQISPHFLFNTLNALSSLVVTGKALEADEMIGRLARFLRITFLTDTAEKVQLSEEMRLELEYLQIEGIRFGERLRIETSITDEAAEALVPHLILQPLLENAIKHGVARSDQPVCISVAARREGKHLIVTVINDVTDGQQPAGAGVGLANVRARLSSHYGDEASMSAERLPGRRFGVTLQLPVELTL